MLEIHLEQAVRQILEWDGWIVRKMEQNYSERKRKVVGESGMADLLAIRYKYPRRGSKCSGESCGGVDAQVLWIEMKRLVAGPERVRRNGAFHTKWPRATQAANHQRAWHARERECGALTLIAGEDFECSVDGFREWYRNSGLSRRTH